MAEATTSRGWMVPVIALFLSAFAVCTAEFIIAGLLPDIAHHLSVDIPTAGLLISGYALGVAIASPVFALLTGSLPRRPLLIVLMAIFVLGNILCALATSYWMLLGARLLVACCHGLFFGVAMVLAMRLAPKDRQTSAVSLVVAGVSFASVLGVPIGAATGNIYGWRTTFWVIAAAGLLGGIAVALLVPSAREERAAATDLRAEIGAALRPTVLIAYIALAFFVMGALGLYSYIVPLLTTVSGVPQDYVPVVLFGMGFCGVFGNLAGGWLADRSPFITMIAVLSGVLVIMLALAALAPSAWGAAVCCILCWLVAYGFPAPIQARILKEAADAPNLASTLSSTANHLGIAIAAALGAAVINAGWGYRSLPLVDAAAEFVALAAVIALALYGRRRLVLPAAAAAATAE
jgi:DHA1 family inner membrane transport protein